MHSARRIRSRSASRCAESAAPAFCAFRVSCAGRGETRRKRGIKEEWKGDDEEGEQRLVTTDMNAAQLLKLLPVVDETKRLVCRTRVCGRAHVCGGRGFWMSDGRLRAAHSYEPTLGFPARTPHVVNDYEDVCLGSEGAAHTRGRHRYDGRAAWTAKVVEGDGRRTTRRRRRRFNANGPTGSRAHPRIAAPPQWQLTD
eukprot:GHVU01126201.1.p2 GENE.GHVU01126201.1~~GHVU01126201.1.p2  ORF type:complete len:198 (-),score=21.03 GHVU01126201.1:16-609(-)